jgi:predicted Rossmann-fold nucleotide-binding protein
MDEFAESIVLIQTLRQASFPVILMGSEYWKGLIDWLRDKMLKQHHYISPEDLDVFTIVDEPAAAIKEIVDFRKSKKREGIYLPSGMRKNNHGG